MNYNMFELYSNYICIDISYNLYSYILYIIISMFYNHLIQIDDDLSSIFSKYIGGNSTRDSQAS